MTLPPPRGDPFPSWSLFFKVTPRFRPLVFLPVGRSHSLRLSRCCHRSLTVSLLPEVASVRLKACFDWSFALFLSGALITGPQLLLTSTARRMGEWRDVPHPQLLHPGCLLVDFSLDVCCVDGSFASQTRLLFS